MEKITTTGKMFLLVVCIMLFAYTIKTTTATATVIQVDGLYIYTDAKPVDEYEYLGTVKPNVVQQGTQINGNDGLSVCDLTYIQLRDNLVKQAKKKYKNSEAIIILPAESKAEVIKFKQ